MDPAGLKMAFGVAIHVHAYLFEGEDVEQLSKRKGIPFIGKIPFDIRVSQQTGSGKLFYTENPDSVTGKAIASVVDNLLKFIKNKSQ